MDTFISELKEKIITEKYAVTAQDAMRLYETPSSQELFEAADSIRKACCDGTSSVCSVINAKQGGCSENCRYCAQSAHHKTSCVPTGMITPEDASALALRALRHQVTRISLVTASRGLSGKNFDAALECSRKIIADCQGRMKLCASLGIIGSQQLRQLKETGVVRYHHNLETSRNFYPNICTTHTYEERIATVLEAKRQGLEICCGGIIGMGESRQDRIDLALAIRELDVQSVPINVLSPIKGTPMENTPPLTEDEILRTIAVFRFIMPSQTLRCAAGRKSLGRNGEAAFKAGANALISGDFLTIPGSTNDDDIQMLQNLGYTLA